MAPSAIRSSPPLWFWALTALVMGGSQFLLSNFYPAGRYGSSSRSKWRVVMVTDQDHASRADPAKHEWTSYLQDATLTRDEDSMRFSLSFADAHAPLASQLAVKGRSMELSALSYVNGELLAFCDRSGQVLAVAPGAVNGTYDVETRALLATGDGATGKAAFKSEWSTKKDGLLYVGSMGKEWVVDGEVQHRDLLWVKVFDAATNTYTSEDWTTRFEALRAYANASYPAYMVNEAVTYDPRNSEWLILPRKLSSEGYDEALDEQRSGNVLFVANEDWTAFRHVAVGEQEPLWGFTEIRLLPDSAQPVRRSDPSLLMAIKVKEFEGELASKVVVFDTEGAIHTAGDDAFVSIPVAGMKFEGLEFVNKNWFNTSESFQRGSTKKKLNWEEYVNKTCSSKEDWSNPLRASVNTAHKFILQVGYDGYLNVIEALL
jgi:soluble calcium-activated nucleotidase 1